MITVKYEDKFAAIRMTDSFQYGGVKVEGEGNDLTMSIEATQEEWDAFLKSGELEKATEELAKAEAAQAEAELATLSNASKAFNLLLSDFRTTGSYPQKQGAMVIAADSLGDDASVSELFDKAKSQLV